MFKKLFTLGLFLALLVSQMAFADTENPNYDEGINISSEITVNGETFILENVPHDQREELNTVNIPLRLGEFNAPVNVHLNSTTPDMEFVTWRISDCVAHDYDSEHYLEYVSPGTFETIVREEDDVPSYDEIYMEDDSKYDSEASFELTYPGCYAISVSVGHYVNDEYIFASEDDIYLIVNTPDGHLETDFDMEFDNSNVSIFNEDWNDWPSVLAPTTITLTDTTDEIGETEIASREWSMKWVTIEDNMSSISALLPISTQYKYSESFDYSLNNLGSYYITLEVTGTNGLTYEKSKWVGLKNSEDYFNRVVSHRDEDDIGFSDIDIDFSEYNEFVDNIEDADLKNLYTEALANCNAVTETFGDAVGMSVECDSSVEDLFEAYDADLFSLDVPCSFFPDLSGYSAYDELCRGAGVVRDVDAFTGDGEGSATAGYLRPDDSINRIETCAILNKSKVRGKARAVASSVSSSKYWDLEEIADDDWRKTNAEACSEFTGNEDGSFRPSNDIILAEILKVLLGMYGADAATEGTKDLSDYCELPDGDWYSDYMALAFEKEILEGLEDTCNPSKVVTRGDVVVMMYRLYYEYLSNLY